MCKYAVLALVIVALSGSSALAHHAFTAEFDGNHPVKLDGVVTEMEWINPHSWIHIDVRKPDGTVEKWKIECGTPNSLMRRGFTKNSLPPGTRIIVYGYQAKDGGLRANGRNMKLQDGRTLFLGSSGTGAPDDGADPTESRKK